MLPPLALAPNRGSFCLDICASPGSKTSFLAGLCGNSGLVLANESNRKRLGTLKANLERMNIFNGACCSYDGKNLPLFPESISHILLDPPCSGWGTAAKHPAAPKIWHDDKIIPLLRLQKQLITQAATLARPGGYIVYSTCTTNSAENEGIIDFAQNHLPLEVVCLRPFPGFVFSEKLLERGLLLVNGEASGSQGFFIALLKKIDIPQSKEQPNVMFEVRQPILLDFPLPAAGEAAIFGSGVRFVPKLTSSCLPQNFIWQAPLLGTWEPKTGFKPQKNLRYPQLLEDSNISRFIFDNIAELNKFLSGARITTTTQKPYALLCWQDLPLGLASIKNGRILNQFMRPTSRAQ